MSKPASRSRVLIVEDHADSALALSMLLRRAGHEVATAHDGETALSTATTFLPNAVLLDLQLPDIDGRSVASTLRSGSKLAERGIIIALSGLRGAEPGDALFDYYLEKPLDFERLRACLEPA